MKIVLDTNVLVSGIFFSGPPAEILRAWSRGKFRLVSSPAILDEYKRVSAELAEKFSGIDVQRILDLIVVHSESNHRLELTAALREIMRPPQLNLSVSQTIRKNLVDR